MEFVFLFYVLCTASWLLVILDHHSIIMPLTPFNCSIQIHRLVTQSSEYTAAPSQRDPGVLSEHS
jgi:hypothetical protein